MIFRALLCLIGLMVQANACEVRARAIVPFQLAGNTILVPVEVNGIAGKFVLDTGAARTIVTPAAVDRFHLALDEWTATTMRGVGGIERHRDADPRSFSMGGVALHRRSLARDSTLRVATLPRNGTDGLLGRDFLSVFDVELDPAARTLTLYDVHLCSGRFIPWSDGYVNVPAAILTDNAVILPVEIEGISLRAMLDTGAGLTMIAAPGMARLGLGLDRLATDPHEIVNGLGPHAVTMWRHRFAGLRVGSDAGADLTLLVAPVRLTPVTDLLLGADWILKRRLWISWSTGQLFRDK